MADQETQDELTAFERELETILALDPVERIERYRRLTGDLDRELNEK